MSKPLKNQPEATSRPLLAVEPMYLDKAQAATFLALSVSTFEAMGRTDKDFPKPRAISPARNGYLLEELRSWGANRPVADRLPPANTGRRKAA